MNNLFDPLEKAGSHHLTIFVGYDSREDISAKILAHTIRSFDTKTSYHIIPLIYNQLYAYGYTNRDLDIRGSTEFTMTRFLSAPIINLFQYKRGHYNLDRPYWPRFALFLDCDMMFTRSVDCLMDEADTMKPISVCKHDYTPSNTYKMDKKLQDSYPKKNWSSVTLWNCTHDKVSNLTLDWANNNEPSYLHRFNTFKEEEIGSLDRKWNYLVGEGMDREEYYGLKENELPYNIHHTLGSPLFRLYQDTEYADLWKDNFKVVMKRPFDEIRDTIIAK